MLLRVAASLANVLRIKGGFDLGLDSLPIQLKDMTLSIMGQIQPILYTPGAKLFADTNLRLFTDETNTDLIINYLISLMKLSPGTVHIFVYFAALSCPMLTYCE